MESTEWNQLQNAVRETMAAENRLVKVRQVFLSEQVSAQERIAVLRDELTIGDRFTALKVSSYLSLEEQKQLFPILVRLTFSHHSDTPTVLKLILSLPHDWIVDTLGDAIKEQYDKDKYAEPGDRYTAYITIMEILKEQDHRAAFSLAEKAISNSDIELQRAAAEFMEAVGRYPEDQK